MKLEIGKKYESATGDVYGPMQPCNRLGGIYKFTDGEEDWTEDGRYNGTGSSVSNSDYASEKYDLIKEHSENPQVSEFWKHKNGQKVRLIWKEESGRCIVLNEADNFRPYQTRLNELECKWVDKTEVNWAAMPAWANWVYKFAEEGVWCWSVNKPAQRLTHFMNADGQYYCGNIPDEFAPKFSGPWQESLTERPK